MRFTSAAAIAAAVTLSLALARPAAAQSGASALTGQLLDQAGAPVAGATIVATALATQAARTAVTDDQGGYAIPLLPPGRYRVVATERGFRTLVRDGIVLETGQ